MSSRVTSDFLSATPPLQFSAESWLPAIPVYTEWICTAAISSASSTAFLIDSTVLSISTTTPLRRPRDEREQTPIMLRPPSSVTSDTMAQIFVVPISNPTRICSRFATASPPLPYNHPVVVSQIDIVSLGLAAVERRHPKGRSHFHEPLPLLLERLLSEMK